MIVGGGTGGCAAALALRQKGLKVALTEPTRWIGGQFTSQAVPPDEHPWIETCGCTATYRAFRNAIRSEYRRSRKLSTQAQSDPRLNPGQGWVSRLCCEPEIAWKALNQALDASIQSQELSVFLLCEPRAATVENDRIRAIEFENLSTGERFWIEATYVLDATELGDLAPRAGAEYRIGAESQAQTGEAHAVAGDPEPTNVQGVTWCFAMGYDPERDVQPQRPDDYDFWKALTPSAWCGPLLSWNTIHAHTGEPHTWTLFGADSPSGLGLFDYRQVVSTYVDRSPGTRDATIVNWPQNDYYEQTTLDVDPPTLAERFEASKALSRSLLYWLQTEAPRPDGGCGYAGLYLRGDLTGTDDGFAMAPYIRESRRLETRFTLLERHVSAADRPGQVVGEAFDDSIGIGAYRIDLHPSANGRPTVDFSALPFQIPMGCLIPVRLKNLLPACKNLGVTHITNGCTRLHPVEWTIGEASGELAAYCLAHDVLPSQVYESPEMRSEFQRQLIASGFELDWPVLRAL